MPIAPATISAIDSLRIQVMRSFKMKTENTVPKRIDVSRKAATRATGDSVMAQRAIP